ncbi:DUF4381 domain-containing protein [Algibacter mikhailovii]|uniref:DUF4381 domain-containing protein n=1 Tax=Algibacter mikhailovii TaxID=425498 RepID=A0A918RC67_9FLAO|nr:DUF4381 domain-containing protein [Algibacter mikhailovii]GGZ91717.1 hypothetical protein GCM10007028_32670 [Algibacter mikhailovii]
MQQDQNIELSPIITPDPIPFTMDTIGWKILFIVLACLILFIAYTYYKKYKQNAYRRTAISNIQKLMHSKENTISTNIVQIMFLLKQTALQTYSRKQVASLEGENWLNFLDSKLNQAVFIKYKTSIASAVYKGEYTNSDSFKMDEFASNSIKWIKHHA